MPVFSYSILIGVEEKSQKYVNAELMIYIVRSKTENSYTEFLSSEVDDWNNEGKFVLVTDNKNIKASNLELSTFEGIGLKPYSSSFGEIDDLDPEIDYDIPEEIFNKSFRFKDSQKYYEFGSASNINSFYDIEMYSNPDRYFLWTVE